MTTASRERQRHTEAARAARARRTDPATSHAAAASVVELRPKQAAVLRMLRKFHGLTDVALVAMYEGEMRRDHLYPVQSQSGIRTRRSELVALGLAEDTGERRPTPGGRNATVWRACASQAGVFARRAA